MYTIDEMVKIAKEAGASDIHLINGLPAKYRIDGELRNMDETPLVADELLNVARALAGEQFDTLMEIGELDSAQFIAGNRCRIHLFKQQGVPSLALRILRDEIPDARTLGLPPEVLELTKLHKGIVLITGETGSGKSTTLAALLDVINHTRRGHIVTLEDPIEYVHTPDLCAINQREVGSDTRSFAEGLRASLREDPDVILIGEMRDTETIETAITAAETGHLVFATLHTGTAADSIDRMVQVFPEGMQQQIRLQLSMCLAAVLTQQLIPKKGGGRALACEYMVIGNAVRNMIRKGDTPGIFNAVSTSAQDGGQSMEQSLVGLVQAGIITRDMALSYAKGRRNEDYVRKNAF